MLWVEDSVLDSGKKFYGCVEEDSFSIVLLIAEKNFFTPVFKGSFHGDKNETAIDLTAKSSPLAMGCIIFCTIMILVELVLRMIGAIPWQDVLSLAIPVWLWLGFYLLNRYIKEKTTRKYLVYLSSDSTK